jgi:hypothetical protein
MDELRRPFFYAALILIVAVILIELGSGLVLRGKLPEGDVMSAISGALPASIRDALEDVDSGEVSELAEASSDIPGRGIPYLAFLDGMVLFTVGLVASSLLIGDRVQGRVQGIATLILSILMILGAIAAIILAIVLLLLMIALLLAVPFGTIAYLAIYGFFDRGGASTVLSLLMILKLAFVVCLFLAQQRFLQNRGLVLSASCKVSCHCFWSASPTPSPRFWSRCAAASGGFWHSSGQSRRS